MTPNDAADLTATQGLACLRAGTLTVEDWARACLARVAARDDAVRAWAYVDADLVLAEARERDRAGPTGPLHGVPIGVKDVILTADMPTQYNSAIYRGFHPRIDAGAIATLRAAGALIFGKTDTVEFAASGRAALSRNPHDLARSPGGSSSGSAAAVADHHVPVTLGTQTGGSTIRPASYCGLYAIKPTWGLVSREGLKLYAATLDTLSWYARSAEDLHLMLSVFDLEATPAIAVPLVADLRIAACRTPNWALAQPPMQDAFLRGVEALRRAGASVADLDLPDELADLTRDQMVIMRSEGRAAFLNDYRQHRDKLHPSFIRQTENAEGYSRAQLCDAYDRAARCRGAFDAIAAGYDAVLVPSAVGEAPLGLADTGSAVFNSLWTLLHVPTVNVPGLRSPGGLPLGLTLTGPRFSDQAMIAIAAAIGPLFAAA